MNTNEKTEVVKTTYTDLLGNEFDALQIPWKGVEEILGYSHRGVGEDDILLCDWLERSGRGHYHACDGWTDENGWGLIISRREP